MNEELNKVRELIATNKTDQAFAILTELTKDKSDLLNQILTLKARFYDIRKKENLNLIASAEAFIIRGQINYALLNLVNESDKKISVSNPISQKTVFLSYNHNDMEISNKLKDKLKAHNINVIIDSEKMLAGEDIQKFIEKCVRETETTISIISKKSLLSAWVAMETINTFYHEKTNLNKKYIACYIEDNFFDRNFTDEALDFIDEELKKIEAIKKKRANKGRNTRDLNNEYTRLKELCNGLDEIVRRLRESLCIDIRGENLENNFEKILQKIQS